MIRIPHHPAHADLINQLREPARRLIRVIDADPPPLPPIDLWQFLDEIQARRDALGITEPLAANY